MCWNTDYKNLVDEMKIVEMKKEKSKQSRQKWTAAIKPASLRAIEYLLGPLLPTQNLPITIL